MAHIESMAAHGRSPETVKQYRRAVVLFADYLVGAGKGDATVADLHADMLTGFYVSLAKGLHGRPRDLVTKRRLVEKIETAWQWLFDQDWHASVPKPRTIPMAKERQKPVMAPTFDEMSRFVLASNEGVYRRLATLLYYTGLRISQARALTWDDVDMDRGLLTIAPHKVESDPGRVIPMSPHLVAELASWGQREGRLLVGLATDFPVRKAMHRAWVRAGVRPAVHKQRPNHAMRRGLVSGLKGLGADVEAAEFYVGHTIQGSRGRYVDGDFLPLVAVANLIPKVSTSKVVAIAAAKESA